MGNFMTRKISLYPLILLLIFGLASAAKAQIKEAPSRDRMNPVTVGEIAPDFTLPDLNGKNVTLSKIGKPIILVFYRGYW